MKEKAITVFFQWISLGVTITIIFGSIYLINQQILRQDANNPQIQIATDASISLAQGQPVLSVVPIQKIDISQSLQPFVMVFDQNGQLLASSGQLNQRPPVFPTNALQSARQNGQERLTWQPQVGVRIAAVIVPYAGVNQAGYILSGRSLKQVELQESTLGEEVATGWVLCLLASYAISFASAVYEQKRKKPVKRHKKR